MEPLYRFFANPRGMVKVDDLMISSKIKYAIRDGLPWRNALPNYGSARTLDSGWRRRSRA